MSLSTISKKVKRDARHNRIRGRMSGTKERPRLAVFRSNQHIYAQLIDDESKTTLCSANDIKSKEKEGVKRAAYVGKVIAQLAQKKGISHIVFDRGGFKYHGIVKTLADAAREAGLTF